MEQPADGFHGSVHLGQGRKVIVLGLRAPNIPTPKRQRRTFWTACASCKEKNKYPIEHLNCNVSCLHCSKSFPAVEVSRPRKQRTTNISNIRGQTQHVEAVQMPLEKRFSEDDITMLLKLKGKEVVEERIKETMCAKQKPTSSATNNGLLAPPVLLDGASHDHYHGGDKITGLFNIQENGMHYS
ncbi:hypothetical protein PVAP13_8NG133204 [Panicum virgatum]|uniref:Uncharacterized protein n=1 Tax=Panicum virgatum TaxID=38727 RepID=A0A8T0PIL1_PANVG|nr:hypothetical protein PVAP13_8NG133204 [Panicum virgatum]